MAEINQYRQELKDRIISYAMPEFYKRGVKAVKMDEISQGLHVSKRTVYEIFGDKEELLLAGEGKRTFGISGLSANLTEMEKGFHRNLKEMFEMKKLSPIEYQLYRIFYRIKYIIRISRNKFLKLQGK